MNMDQVVGTLSSCAALDVDLGMAEEPLMHAIAENTGKMTKDNVVAVLWTVGTLRVAMPGCQTSVLQAFARLRRLKCWHAEKAQMGLD